MDAGGSRPALQSRNSRIRPVDEGARLSGDQPDGQGAGAAARRYDRHRGGGDLRLSCGRLSRGRPRAAAGLAPARPLLSLAVLRRGPDRGGQHQQGARVRSSVERTRMVGYGTSERVARRARGSAQPLRVHRGRPLHRRGRLCRIAYRLGHDVRRDRQATGVRALLGAPERASGRSASARDRRRARRRQRKAG